MSTLVSRPGPSDSLMVAIAIAVALHVAFIGLVHFEFLGRGADSVPTSLDVLLVEWETEEPPEEADFLAQVSQRGGGTGQERELPAEPVARAVDASNALFEQEQRDAAEQEELEDSAAVVALDEEELLNEARDATEQGARVELASQQLLEQSRMAARASVERMSDAVDYPERPRRRFVSANTREHLYAGYMRSWVAKVERVGNLNYPEQARRHNLAGALVLSVDVLQDGSVSQIRLLRSSGYDVLDEAAVRIVRLSAPFAPLPEEIRREVDVLTITRTWQFSRGGVLRGS